MLSLLSIVDRHLECTKCSKKKKNYHALSHFQTDKIIAISIPKHSRTSANKVTQIEAQKLFTNYMCKRWAKHEI